MSTPSLVPTSREKARELLETACGARVASFVDANGYAYTAIRRGDQFMTFAPNCVEPAEVPLHWGPWMQVTLIPWVTVLAP